MSKIQKTREDLIEMFINSLEEGNIPWQQMWKTSAPENGITGIKYKGINNLYLTLIAQKRGYQDNRWITFNQMAKNQWKFIKPAKGQGILVEWWTMKNKKTNKIISFEEYRKIIEEDPNREKEFKMSKMNYIVYNGDLIDGLVNNKVEQKEEVISNNYVNNIIDNLGVGYKEEGEEAYYNPTKDEVVLPPSNIFKTSNSFYATQLHELAHSTGHESRLKRNIKNSFGSEEYAKEELRAEISSAFLMQKFHLEEDKRHLNNHKSYVKNWLEILKNDPKELFAAITDANKIVEYLEENSIKKEKIQGTELIEEMEMDI